MAGSERILRRVLEIDSHNAFAVMTLGFIVLLTDRPDEAVALADRTRELSSQPIYKAASYVLAAWAHLWRGDSSAATHVVREGRAAEAHPDSLRCIEAFVAARTGDLAGAKRLVAEVEDSPVLRWEITMLSAVVALVGDLDHALAIINMTPTEVAVSARVIPDMHPLADHPSLAPRRWDQTLVWPLEAPKIDAARYALFKEVRIETGIPQGSDIRAT
jgi:hypothetical protein